jgi:cation transporter-like permease
MTLAANGALIAVSGSPLATAEHLEILKAGTTAWCVTSGVLPAATRQDPVVAIQSSELAVVVSFLTPIPKGGGTKAMALAFPLSTLRCRT